MAKTPVNRESIKKLIDVLTPMNPESAEKFVQELLRVADERRKELEKVVGEVARAGFRTAEGLASTVQQEMAKQMTKMASRIDELERQVDALNTKLESTRTNLLTAASRSLARAGEVKSDDEGGTVTPSSSSRKQNKKAAKKARKAEKSGKGANGSKGESSSEDVRSPSAMGQDSSDGSTAVAGI